MNKIKISPCWELRGFCPYPLIICNEAKKTLLKKKLATITGKWELTLVKDWEKKDFNK